MLVHCINYILFYNLGLFLVFPSCLMKITRKVYEHIKQKYSTVMCLYNVEEEIDIIPFGFVHGPICFSISPKQHELLSQQTEV